MAGNVKMNYFGGGWLLILLKKSDLFVLMCVIRGEG